MLLITLPFLFVVRLDARRWLTLWLVCVPAALATYVSVRGTGVTVLGSILGGYGSLPHVIWINLPLVTVLGYFVRDRLRLPPTPRSE